jgi:tRNA(Ile)-lysidine synthase
MECHDRDVEGGGNCEAYLSVIEVIRGDRVAPGRWVVGVSGGADSVALLRLLVGHRPEVEVVAAHVDHELRGEASAGDAVFVREICERLGVRCEVVRLSEIDSCGVVRDAGSFDRGRVEDGARTSDRPEAGDGTRRRLSYARSRAMRLRWFGELVARHEACGVMLGHHADDQAETVALRMLRGGEAWALGGMRDEERIGGLRVVRPLLGVRKLELLAYLSSIGQTWREDASNAERVTRRNEVRVMLGRRPVWAERLLEVGARARALDEMLEAMVEGSGGSMEELEAGWVAGLPAVLGRRVVRRWLRGRGVGVDRMSVDLVDRVVEMARDRSRPSRMQLPGGSMLRRRGGRLWVE